MFEAVSFYPVKQIYYLTLLYMKQPNMTSNIQGRRDLRLRIFIKVANFERMTSIGPHLTEEGLAQAFPWQQEGNLQQLPTMDETMSRYEEILRRVEEQDD